MQRWISRLEIFHLLALPAIAGLIGILQPQVAASQAPHVSPAFGTALAAFFAPLVAGLLLAILTRGADILLLSVAAMLTSLSVVVLYVAGQEVTTASEFFQELALRQALFVTAGYVVLTVGVLVAQRIDDIARYPYTLAIGGVLLTTTTVLIGATVNGARLWLDIGPFRFQPGEVSRLLLTTFIAIYLYTKRHHLAGTWRVSGVAMPATPHLVPLAVGVLMAIAVLAWQNDLGMAAAIGLVAGLFAAGAMWSPVGAALTGGIVVSAMGLAYALVPRVRTRADLWIDPWSAPTLGGYQFVQGDYALAAGGLAGTSTTAGVSRVPEFHTDFVLIAIGSRFGFIAVVATLCLLAVLVLRCLVVALRARSELAAFVAIGMALMLGVQGILIVGGTLRLLPLTGLTVPLVSYGGTSMLVTLFALGVVIGLGSEPRWNISGALGSGNARLSSRFTFHQTTE